MKNYIHTLQKNLAGLFVTGLILSGNMTAKAQTVFEVIANSPDHTLLETAIIAAGLDDDLQTPGPFTVFAPTDDAINALGSTITDLVVSDPTGELATVLLYHVLEQNATSGSLTNGTLALPMYPANTLKITVASADGAVSVNQASVTTPDLTATNGTVHVIDAVLLPDETVADVIIDSPDHTTLEAAVIAAELLPALTDPDGTYTVFGPTDAAFTALGSVVTDLLADPTGDLRDILLYHVLGSEVASSNLANGAMPIPLNTANSLKVTITSSDGDVYINQAQVTTPDVAGGTGIVHVIDAVLLPTETVADVIIDSPDHSTLETAVVQAELLPALTDPAGTYTVFGPTDAAFNALGSTLTDLLADPTGDLRDILLYHVLGSKVLSSSLSNGAMPIPLNTANSIKVTVTSPAGDVFVNQAQVTTPDVEAGSGVVHVTDAVILPNETVADVIIDSPDHITLETAVIAAELLPALTDPAGTYTVFGPTDAAFAALGTVVTDLLLDPTGDLKDILLYHVLDAEVASGDLSNGDIANPLNTANTLKVTVTTTSDVFINQAEVTTPDVAGGNGLIHVVDAVLLPNETVADVIIGSPSHTTLETAVIAAELLPALTDPAGTYTVFGPTDAAFSALGSVVTDLLADPTGDLKDILLYHVLNTEVASGDLTNGDLATPLNAANTLKITVTTGSSVYINQAQVTAADIPGGTGLVHVVDAVLLPNETVADVIIDSPDHTTLETAVIAAELLPALTDPAGTYTVFGPTDAAFSALGSVVTDLLADPTGDLRDILLYHVLDTEVASGDLSNGDIATPLNTANTLKVTVTTTSDVFINQAQVTTPDVAGGTGLIHVVNAVLLPNETVADIIIDSPDHTTLETAVIAAELLPALTDPAGTYTVFAPDDAAFTALGSTLNDLLADPTGELKDILLFHVVGSENVSSSLSNNQMITMLSGDDATITIENTTVSIEDAIITQVDLQVDNGVVHVINGVITPGAPTGLFNTTNDASFRLYPNPTTSAIYVDSFLNLNDVMIINQEGKIMENYRQQSNSVDVSALPTGNYIIRFTDGETTYSKTFAVQ